MMGAVSRLVSRSEYEEIRRLWLEIHSPMSLKEAESWRIDWLDALKRLHYLEVLRLAPVGGWDYSLEIRLALTGTVPLDGARADLETLWSKDISEGLEALHAIVEGSRLWMGCVGLTTSRSVLGATLEMRT